MTEDEQILLQNLSPYRQSPVTYSKNTTKQLLLDVHQEAEDAEINIITEKQKQRRYYIDWSNRQNHNYFTKIAIEDIQADENELNAQRLDGKNISSYHEIYYNDLANKLELALMRIKINAHSKEAKLPQKRSQSIEPRKQRDMALFSRNGKDFREDSANKRKKSVNSRYKTQSEEENWADKHYPANYNRMEKYQTRHVITEEREQLNDKESCKENALRNKFLVSIALWQEKKQRRIQQRIEKEMKISMQGVTFTPEINAKSREIMKKKGIITPIYERQYRQKKRELTQRFNVEHKTYRAKN